MERSSDPAHGAPSEPPEGLVGRSGSSVPMARSVMVPLSEITRCFKEVLVHWAGKPQTPTAERVLWEILGRLEALENKEEHA